MSCDFRPITTITRWTLPFVLILAAAPSSAHAQSPDCYPVRRGDTATQLARRITGDSRNTYQPWFQIMDPSARFVPKSQYHRIRPGWRACIVRETVASSPLPDTRRDLIAARDVLPEIPVVNPRSVAAEVRGAVGAVDLMWVWLGAVIVLPLVGWILDDYVARRRTVLVVMRHFAHRFVREFERPLILQPTEHPVRARLRLRPARARLEILLAPGLGRRYPNLSDHKKNVEYDVVRVFRLIADDSFVRDPLYTRAGWVVVPFRFEVGRKR